MKVAVYGTLRQGQGNHRLLESSKFLGMCKTKPFYNMYSLGAFPGITLNGNTPITIEVYEIDDFTLVRLDSLEGFPNFYNRMQINTEFGSVWIYYLNDNNKYYKNNRPPIESGDWMAYISGE